MPVKKIMPVIEGIADIEEIKTNLTLIGAEWHTKPCGRSEVVIVICDEGQYQVRIGGSLEKIAGKAGRKERR